MPNYDYINGSGVVVSLNVPVAERDKQEGYQRISVAGPAVKTRPALSPIDQREGIRRGYYKEECQKGSRFYSGYSKETIRKVWGI